MKHYILTALLTQTTIIAVAQTNTFPNSGNVGIGTTSPLAPLDVRNGKILVKNLANQDNESVIMIDHSLTYGPYEIFGTSLRTFTESAASNRYALQFFTQSSYTTGQTEKVRITGEGNIGIGTATPSEKLDVKGNVVWDGYKGGNPRALSIGYSGGNYGGIGYNIDYTGTSGVFNRPLNDQSSYLEFRYGGFNFYGNANSTSANGVNLNGGGNNLNLFAVITRTGDFGIGTDTPKEKLSVNGKIRAHEIKVETTNWPDYVFEEGYEVGTLAALESYIKANKHLPEVPSAKDVAANGVELGEMNKVLLKKIEELTLHLIEKEKEISIQGQQIKLILKEQQELKQQILKK